MARSSSRFASDSPAAAANDGAEIRMEFTVDTGKGYVPASENRTEDQEIGLIPVDVAALAARITAR